MIPLLRCLPILLGLIALLGCNSTTVEENEAIPVPTAETAAEDAYGTTFMNLMVEFKANADLANQELDEAMAKGLPKDPKERRREKLKPTWWNLDSTSNGVTILRPAQ